jgi:hypothetical protein
MSDVSNENDSMTVEQEEPDENTEYDGDNSVPPEKRDES